MLFYNATAKRIETNFSDITAVPAVGIFRIAKLMNKVRNKIKELESKRNFILHIL